LTNVHSETRIRQDSHSTERSGIGLTNARSDGHDRKGTTLKDREGAMAILAQIMATNPEPLGTRYAALELEARGVEMSESSVSRLLRAMDSRGWTTPVGTKGRVLSAEGRRQAAESVLADRTSASLKHPVKDVEDLLDLLRARRAVESAVAGDAARSPDQESLQSLERLCDLHHQHIGEAPMIDQPGLTFHRAIVAMCGNRMLKVAGEMMLAPHLDRVESVLDTILATRRAEEQVIAEHREVFEFIRSGDAAGAEGAMRAHFDAMIAATENSVVGDSQFLVEQLLRWAPELR
jgi:GntR family transcriptional regulator, transcriptional repressor for pyruvate dehydrogenase complex